MDEIRGWSAIDTLYEIKGFEITARLFGYLYPAVVGIMLGFGLVHVLYKTTVENRYRAIAAYVAISLFLAWLIAPTQVRIALPAGYAYNATLKDLVHTAETSGGAAHGVEAPRVMVWTHALIDWLQRLLVRAVDRSFEKEPFGHDRGAVLLRLAKIHDPDLRQRYHTFILWCHLRAMAAREKDRRPPPAPYYDPFKIALAEYGRFAIPGTEPVADITGSGAGGLGTPDLPCSTEAAELSRKVIEHVRDARELEDARTVVLDLLVSEGTLGHGTAGSHYQPVEIVKGYVLYNETIGLLAADEIKALQRALPDYEMFDRKTQTDSNSQTAGNRIRSAVSWLVKGWQSIDQWIKHRAEGPALYFKVTSYGPYAYGIAGMILLAIFPFAAFVALFPGHWSALFTWAKYLLWVKLWMVFWSILSRFNEWRYSLDDIGSDPSNGIGDQTYIFPAIAAMYLLTPALSLIVVQLLSAAGKGVGGAIGSFVGASGGAGGQVLGQAQQAVDQLGQDGVKTDSPSPDINIAVLIAPEATPEASDPVYASQLGSEPQALGYSGGAGNEAGGSAAGGAARAAGEAAV